MIDNGGGDNFLTRLRPVLLLRRRRRLRLRRRICCIRRRRRIDDGRRDCHDVGNIGSARKRERRSKSPRDIGRAGGRTVLPPASAGFSLSSSSFVVAVFSVVVVFIITPPPDRPIPRFLPRIAPLLGVVDKKS